MAAEHGSWRGTCRKKAASCIGGWCRPTSTFARRESGAWRFGVPTEYAVDTHGRIPGDRSSRGSTRSIPQAQRQAVVSSAKQSSLGPRWMLNEQLGGDPASG
jgi:hypothetical protein